MLVGLIQLVAGRDDVFDFRAALCFLKHQGVDEDVRARQRGAVPSQVCELPIGGYSQLERLPGFQLRRGRERREIISWNAAFLFHANILVCTTCHFMHTIKRSCAWHVHERK